MPRLEAVCAECGAPNALGNKFCGECGKPLGAPATVAAMPAPSLDPDATNATPPPGGSLAVDTLQPSPANVAGSRSTLQGERRLVTILFADVSGFTAMSQKLDHETVNQVMRVCWAELDQVVVQYGGTVDKHIGDALMATFGATVAHEDDPLAAVRASLTLQGRLAAFSQNLEAATGAVLPAASVHWGRSKSGCTMSNPVSSTATSTFDEPTVTSQASGMSIRPRFI